MQSAKASPKLPLTDVKTSVTACRYGLQYSTHLQKGVHQIRGLFHDVVWFHWPFCLSIPIMSFLGTATYWSQLQAWTKNKTVISVGVKRSVFKPQSFHLLLGCLALTQCYNFFIMPRKKCAHFEYVPHFVVLSWQNNSIKPATVWMI